MPTEQYTGLRRMHELNAQCLESTFDFFTLVFLLICKPLNLIVHLFLYPSYNTYDTLVGIQINTKYLNHTIEVVSVGLFWVNYESQILI